MPKDLVSVFDKKDDRDAFKVEFSGDGKNNHRNVIGFILSTNSTLETYTTSIKSEIVLFSELLRKEARKAFSPQERMQENDFTKFSPGFFYGVRRNDRYPNVMEAEDRYIITQHLLVVKHQMDTRVFEEDLRILIDKTLVGQSIQLSNTVHAKKIRVPLKINMTIVVT